MSAADAGGTEAAVLRDRVVAKVPASTANLGPGFDTLGMALSLYEWIDLRPAAETTITLYGDNLEGVPRDKSNLVYEVAQAVFARAGREVPELAIGIRSDIPLTRGLGSSASAIVGALVAANALIGDPLSADTLFQMATALENHPDNVGASLFGGIVAAAWDGSRAEAVRFDPPAGLAALVAIPAFELSTKHARNVLPREVPLGDAVFNVAHGALLTAALATGRLDVLKHALRDRLHQPYRAALVPGMETILREAPDHGALGAVLSGAGPTLLLLAEAGAGRPGELERFVTEVMAAEGIAVSLRWLEPCLDGPEVRAISVHEPDYGREPHQVLAARGREVRA
ncbi:homoserine kinase [Cohnella nanjingensis]|uniref:Homoserine kinase n=2 Tax=Cohnella nanjingensis TaxID=1387779 RepID=A0A7X0RVC9_9BACL|nr:homoserine kinase [Cohnella nanjingensis]MBB6674256.1 homoserine kinase [Cohnella nanjingensis]